MPTLTRRPTQQMYPSPERDDDNANDDDDFDEEDEQAWGAVGPLAFSRSQLSSSLRSRTSTRPRPSLSTSNRAASSSTNASQYSKLYSQFVTRYRSNPEENPADDPRNDPDSHYFQRGLGQLNDAGDTSDDEDLGSATLLSEGLDGRAPLSLDSEPAQPLTQEDKERLEWQSLLTSVLSGDVLKTEKSRIAVALSSQGDELANYHVDLWHGIRAKFHGRSVEEERKKLDERRLRTVDAVINEILNFRVSDPQPDQPNPTASAFSEVDTLLRRLDVVQSLYPSLKVFYTDKPMASEPAFQSRCDTLNTWYTVHTTLKHHFALLRRWTGSDTLDVTQPYTSHEIPISMPRSGSNTELADGTSFVERLLKEESMQLTFEKGFLVVVHNFLGAARDAQVNLAALFKEMNLPTFERELLPLISFPTKLVQACLRLRLDYIRKLKEPDVVIIDSMTEDLKLSIGLACTLKRQYEAILAPDPGGNWSLEQCISGDYDDTILDATLDFFKLIHWKLKSGSKAILFKETDVLEAQWGTFNDVSITAAGGSSLVAEQLCSLTNKLMVRVTNYFETQVRVPTGKPTLEQIQQATYLKIDHEQVNINNLTPTNSSDVPRTMSDEQVIGWYSKILESVRLRYRKLQRFARMLTQQFSNSAEYSLDDVSMEDFISLLVTSDHFLVYTHCLEEDGIYIVASHALYDQTDLIHKMLDEAFQVAEQITEDGIQVVTNVETNNQYPETAGYLLILSPQSHFLWNGRVVLLSIPRIPLEMKDNRVLLVADGSQRRLNFAKQSFLEALEVDDEDGEGSMSLNLPCIAEAQAHLPNVNRELRKIARSTNRLAESIVDSVHQVRSSLRGTDGGQEILANWYIYASEHGQHAHKYLDRQSLLKFNRLLIKLAISWVSFICDDCDPTDSKTFKWAVNALEYTLHRTKRYILHLPDEQFELLRQKVASCMTLLISHFDILGARSIQEAKKEKEKHEEILKSHKSEKGLEGDDFSFANGSADPNSRLFWERVWRALREVDESRKVTGIKHRTLGKVLSEEIAEDRSLSSLASSSSNISVKWQQGKFIGAGAFGSVYLALNLDNGTLMAVKEIKFQELSGLSNLYSQIKEELSVMEMLHHPNVVEYYGIEVHRDKVYIFEEYCQGGSLAALLEHGRIEEESIIQVYTMQLLEGLAYLHSKGIVHRDVKPDNVLLDHDGVIKFVDFGAAKILAKNQRTFQRTRKATEMPFNMGTNMNGVPELSNGLTGTPMYMSPEVIKNDKRGRLGAMDIWSMGCVVLEFATGKKPWSNLDNEWAIMFHIGVATQHPPLPEPDQLSEMGINFIKQCLTIDPVRRPTADELMNHPWMLDFRETLMQYEATELTADSSTLPPEDFENATVARQAAIIHEQEIEDIHGTSPTTTPPSS
ncbi:hypothetical protein CPB83DRAFT_910537 [Crepidotus variabilis]|uniref:Protein kinase domain-containing protein n=1 Tax=Crepidotus variabilis TaxID=179855 RepID=A0A9P6E755_9AGAR|nr:hypothetical protein CPB83DRAFT_910537 [Crepidotus variabilis]